MTSKHTRATPEHRTSPPSRSPSISPSKSRQTLAYIVRRYQEKASDLEAEVQNLKRKTLADVTNGNEDSDAGEGSDGEPAAKKSRAGDGPEDTDLLAEVGLLGRRFVLKYGMWLINGTETFLEQVDDNYEASEHFETVENKVQGQLQDLLECIPIGLHSELENLWFGKTSMKASTTSNIPPLEQLRSALCWGLTIEQARWSLSPDVQLVTPGDRTGINYAANFDQYLERLLYGIQHRKHWTRQLF
ncbi:hypothetical protein C8J56DRAFT_886553 [Mycena floridula]|nr:hypothetical protein C8J56DRAFT_886553 [Mycena floridula]